MKRINPIIFVVALLFFASCQEAPKKEKKEERKPKMAEEDKTPPSGIITLNEAKVLCENYEERRLPGIREFEMANNLEEEFVPTQFIDFDFKTIHKYVKFVEREARKAGVRPDSLRIYLGNYGKEGQQPNRNTVFLLPTTTIDGERGGFYIDGSGNAKLIRNYWPKNENGGQEGESKSKASLMPNLSTSVFQDQSFIMNHGSGGPPPTGDF